MIISGPSAFYKQDGYDEKTEAELKASYPPSPPLHIYESGNRWVRIILKDFIINDLFFHGSSIVLVYTIATFCLKKISRNRLAPPALPMSTLWITLPVGFYNIAYIGTGWVVHAHSYPLFRPEYDLDAERGTYQIAKYEWSSISKERKLKRFTIQADGYVIDALMVGREENLGKHNFIIYLHGNSESYEMLDERKLKLADELEAIAVFYNYPSTIRSSGWFPNLKAMVASHQAMHAFVKELGAEVVIDFAHSIGCGVQGESLKRYPLNDDVKRVVVKHKTFGELATLVNDLMFWPLGTVVRLLRWNYSSVESSRNSKDPELIIQQGKDIGEYVPFEQITDSKRLVSDGLITAKGSLAKALLDDPNCPKDNKVFIIVKGHQMEVETKSGLKKMVECGHHMGIQHYREYAQLIKTLLTED
ncbi:MAG: hypothetical protein K1060chlam2_01083 [Chlamydiae bacterium]|nr:hypothetical protein [Chlamydiota bacterium]